MLVKITSKRQVSFPARVLEAMGVGPGDRLELAEGPDGYIIRPRRFDYSKLGTLSDKLPSDVAPLDVGKFRERPYDPSLRD